MNLREVEAKKQSPQVDSLLVSVVVFLAALNNRK